MCRLSGDGTLFWMNTTANVGKICLFIFSFSSSHAVNTMPVLLVCMLIRINLHLDFVSCGDFFLGDIPLRLTFNNG